jgi:hypothetical protein
MHWRGKQFVILYIHILSFFIFFFRMLDSKWSLLFSTKVKRPFQLAERTELNFSTAQALVSATTSALLSNKCIINPLPADVANATSMLSAKAAFLQLDRKN